MTRAANSIATLSLAAITMVLVGGCASWRNRNEKIIRVEASQDPAKAARLTDAGIKALTCGNTELASNKFLAAVDADMAYGPAHNNLGLMHYEQGNLYQAVLAFEQAMEFMEQDPTVLYNLALTLEAAGKVNEALDLYMQAAEMDPVNPNFLGNLVRLRIRMGDHDPSLVAQLQDLILIETRPEWRSWADQQLAMNFNPLLDRGPDTPEFDLNADREKVKDRDRNVDDQIIDLTPSDTPSASATKKNTLSEPLIKSYEPPSSSPILAPPQMDPVPVPQPMPIFDDAPVETLPPSIQLNPDDLPVEMDYFR
jgi:tetratricopeptide (TPR) repeat protein